MITAPASPRPKPARIEIIPLIDVIFFLLATFVLFTLSLQRLRSLELELPRGGTETPPGDTTAYVQATDGGTYFWRIGDAEAESLTLPELAVKLENYRRTTAVPRVLLRSDGKARLGTAVAALDEVRRVGIQHVAVETRVSLGGR